MRLTISAPRNNFKLHEDAGDSVLVAGGIGITPLLCMGRRLQQQGRPFEFLVFARSRKSAAFVAEVEALGAPVLWHFDTEQGGPPDLKALLAARPAQHGATRRPLLRLRPGGDARQLREVLHGARLHQRVHRALHRG
jgi:ferredoxin-NADP reductase